MAEPVSKIDTKALESGPIIVNAEMLKLAQEKVEREKEEKENYKKIDIRKKQEDLESTVRILFLSGLTVDYSIGIDRINTEWVLIRF